jgi:hypothetical protein
MWNIGLDTIVQPWAAEARGILRPAFCAGSPAEGGVRGVSPLTGKVLDIGSGLGEALDVRVIRAHEDVAGTDQREQRGQVVLVEGGHPDVPPEGLAGILGVQVGDLAVGLGELLVAVPVFRPNGLQLAEQDAGIGALGITAAEVLVHDPGRRDRVEGGVRDELVHLAPHQQVGLAVQLRPLHGPLAVGRLDVPGERIGGLVVVVIAVEEPERQLSGHEF